MNYILPLFFLIILILALSYLIIKKNLNSKKTGTDTTKPIEIKEQQDLYNFFKHKLQDFEYDIVAKEKEILDKENKYKKILDSFISGIYISTPEYKIEYLNNSMIQEIGYDATGSSCYEAIYKKNKKCEWCIFDKLKKNEDIIYEHYNSEKDKYYQIKNSLLENGNNLSIHHDITSLKKSEKKLITSEMQFRDLFDFSPLPMLIHSNGKIVIANNATVRFFETTDITKIVGRPVIDFIHPEQVEKVKQNLNKVYSKGWQYGTIIHKLITVKSNIKFAEVTGFLTSYENCPAIHIVLNDVTEKQQTEQALKESEEKYKKLINDSSIGIGIFKDTKIYFANTALQKMFGFNNYDSFIKNPISNYLTNESRLLLQKRIDNNKNGLPVESTTVFKIIRKDGQIRNLKIRASNIILNNEKLRHVTFIDITERLKAEEELKNSEAELIKTNSQKDKFFSILAHDLKNPFNTLLGFTELLHLNHNKYNAEKRHKFISLIYDNAKNIHNLLENLLLWSRNQRNRINYKPKQINLYNLIQENFRLFTPAANEKNIKLLNFVKKDIEAFADYNMIDTVLRNLLSNAIKFTSQKGKITVKSELINQPEEMIKISVEDTGIGITKENLPKLFSISDNFTTEGTENEKGTGLGLILCKEFIEKHKGKIWVESSIDKGSSFIITLNKHQ
ncbi:MAG: PAS domain-containing sensor histidine kinase [Chlorobi bacterium]|nr:PAS domain-containing sensor histidine kinase [Chlorobiota bacterium]